MRNLPSNFVPANIIGQIRNGGRVKEAVRNVVTEWMIERLEGETCWRVWGIVFHNVSFYDSIVFNTFEEAVAYMEFVE